MQGSIEATQSDNDEDEDNDINHDLVMAAIEGNADKLASLLKNERANPEVGGNLAIRQAVAYGSWKCVKLLLDHPLINLTSDHYIILLEKVAQLETLKSIILRKSMNDITKNEDVIESQEIKKQLKTIKHLLNYSAHRDNINDCKALNTIIGTVHPNAKKQNSILAMAAYKRFGLLSSNMRLNSNIEIFPKDVIGVVLNKTFDLITEEELKSKARRMSPT